MADLFYNRLSLGQSVLHFSWRVAWTCPTSTPPSPLTHTHIHRRSSLPQQKLVEFQDLGSRLGDASIVCLPAGLPVFLWKCQVLRFAQSDGQVCAWFSARCTQEEGVDIKRATQMETGECWWCFVTSCASVVPMGSRGQAISQWMCRDPSLPLTPQNDGAQLCGDACSFVFVKLQSLYFHKNKCFFPHVTSWSLFHLSVLWHRYVLQWVWDYRTANWSWYDSQTCSSLFQSRWAILLSSYAHHVNF